MRDALLSIDIIKKYWIDGNKDNPEDLCLHGDVTVKFGDKLIVKDYHCTISSTALYLLKSVEKNHKAYEESNQMLPCCGHSIFQEKDKEEVLIVGCPNGFDWSVEHNKENVILRTKDNNEIIISLNEYKKVVATFADEVEDFYNQCSPKELPEDAYDKEAYLQYWIEFRSRRSRC